MHRLIFQTEGPQRRAAAYFSCREDYLIPDPVKQLYKGFPQVRKKIIDGAAGKDRNPAFLLRCGNDLKVIP
jgi:hypothetical protein